MSVPFRSFQAVPGLFPRLVAVLIASSALVLAAPPPPPFPQNVLVHQDRLDIAQGETTQATDPGDPQHRVVAWINRGPSPTSSIGVAVTRDGGRRWRGRALATPFGLVESADPVLAVDSRRIFYLATLAWNTGPDGFPTDDHMFLFRSTDGGDTFTLLQDLASQGFPDKEWILVDPVTDALYLFWSDAPGIVFRRSLDGGQTFSAPVAVSDPLVLNPINAIPTVGPDGTLYLTYFDFAEKIFLDRSFDGGVTWRPRDILVERRANWPDPIDHNPGLPTHDVDRSGGPHRGRLYVVWPDLRFGDQDIVIVHSDDRGETWSAPTRVNDDAPGNGALQSLPWVTVDPAGRVHVMFLDGRGTPGRLTLATYLATSTDGGVTFAPNIRVSDGFFAADQGPRFLGDYNQMVVAGARIHPIWSDGRSGDTDIITQGVTLVDFDDDGVLNDGDGDGQFSNHPCSGGFTTSCDDNCAGVPNAGQADGDGDFVGDACDNCPAAANASQSDLDRDRIGDACDPAGSAMAAEPDKGPPESTVARS
jgi:hypothetical protein